VGVEARAGARDGDVDVGSVEGLRPLGVPVAGGFLVAVDMIIDVVMLREGSQGGENVGGRSRKTQRLGATILDKTRLSVKNRTAQLRLVLSLRFCSRQESDVKIHKNTQRRSL
jgi:hypothetical protein